MLKLVESDALTAEEIQAEKLKEFETRNREFQDAFWESFQVGAPGPVAIKKGATRLSIHEVRKINALLNAKGHFIIEHTHVPTPDRSGVPIFELSTPQRRVYYATRLKLFRKYGHGLMLCADGPHNGAPAVKTLLIADRRDANEFFTLQGPREELEREAVSRERVQGVLECHKIFAMREVQVTLSKNKLVIRYDGDYFPGELIITFEPKSAMTLVGAEEQRYAGSYTMIPTADVRKLSKLSRSKRGHKNQIRAKSKRTHLR